MAKIAIFDLDGTLYRQLPVRITMTLKLLLYVLRHPSKWRLIYGIYCFRALREDEKYRKTSTMRQVHDAAIRSSSDEGELHEAVDKWLMKVPLEILPRYRNGKVIDLFNELANKGYKTVVYSDYPVEDKLKALNVCPDYIFYPSEESFWELKPSKYAMDHILNVTNANPEESIYIGDRWEKDGRSAELCGIRYIQVSKRGIVINKES